MIHTFQVTRSSSLISSTLWGHKNDSHLLYVSAAAHDHKGKGVHKIYDMSGQQKLYTLKNQMAGEVMALSNQSKLKSVFGQIILTKLYLRQQASLGYS